MIAGARVPLIVHVYDGDAPVMHNGLPVVLSLDVAADPLERDAETADTRSRLVAMLAATLSEGR